MSSSMHIGIFFHVKWQLQLDISFSSLVIDGKEFCRDLDTNLLSDYLLLVDILINRRA